MQELYLCGYLLCQSRHVNMLHSNAQSSQIFSRNLLDMLVCDCRNQPRQLYGKFPNAQSAPARVAAKPAAVANTSTRARFLWGLVSQRLLGAIRARRAMQGT